MEIITLKNVRENSDITSKVRLKDGGMYIDWSDLSDIKAYIYSDVQKAIAGPCVVTVSGSDNTILNCDYSSQEPQYLGINRIVINAKYRGRTKTYDKAAFNIVPRTSNTSGDIVLDDPIVDLEIEVSDVSSSILERTIDAAIAAAAHAEHAASLVPLQVLQDCEQATIEANLAADHATPYIGENGHWWRWDNDAGEYRDTGEVAKGPTGNGIQSVEQTGISEESGGENIVTVTMTDGTTSQFRIRNGKQGVKGAPGAAKAKYKQVETLPTAGADTMEFIYLTPSGSDNFFNMYYTEQDGDAYSWKGMGTTAIQLEDYATKDRLVQLDKATDEKFMNSRTKTELNASWSAGYIIYSSGEASGSPSYNKTELNVREGQFIQVLTEASSAAAVIAAYDENDDYLIDASVAGTGSMHTYNYVVPSGVTKLRLSVYNRASDKHVYEYGPLYSALNEYADERVDVLQAKLIPLTKDVLIPVNAGVQTLTINIPTIAANKSVSLGVSGDVVVTTIRVDGNEIGQQRSDITAIGQKVTYTPTVDVNALVLYLNGVTSAGTISVTVDYGNNGAGTEDRLDYVEERQDNEEDCFGKALNLPLDVGFFIYDSGEVSANTNYVHTTDYLPVKTGDKFAFLCDHGTSVGSVMAYDANYNYIKDLSLAGSGSYRATSYVVPTGVEYLRFTFNNTDNLTKYVSKIHTSKKTVKDEIDTADYMEGVELTSSNEYWLDENYHKTNWIMQANFREIGSGFSAIFVGKGWLYFSNGMTIKITPTYVQTLYNASGWYLSEEHGLTIGDYLDVRVESYADRTNESPEYTGDGDATFVRITLFDGVSEYTVEKAFFTGGGKPFVRIDGATAKADFYYWCTDLKRDLWCYGDSYFSIAQTRWPYWAITRGFNALWNGKPGANSQFMWANFARDLQHGNPRKVFWCLGMNDKDTGGAPNADWSRYLQRVKDICRLRGIELVMATIPIVPSTEADNTYKNQVVRSSGYKYVDFAAAVMKPDGTGWYDGMMMDATHPSKTGARCLANAAMKLLISYSRN